MNWLEPVKKLGLDEEQTAFRSKGVGASDMPIIMGESPFKTVHQLWLEKTGKAEPFKGNYATERGHRLEPVAREWVEKLHGRKYPAEQMSDPEYPFIRCSFDGINKEDKLIIEIKCPGQKDQLTALSGHIPDKYKAQVQYQLLVSGYSSGYYVSFDGNDGYAVIMFKADPEYQSKLFEKAKWFWNLVETNTPPPMTEEFRVVETIAPGLEDLISDYKMMEAAIKELEEKQTKVREEIKSKVAFRVDVYGYRCQYVERKGNVDYKAIEELKHVDLEKYRKPSTQVFEIRKINAGKRDSEVSDM